MDREGRRESVVALLVVVTVHATVAAWLAGWRVRQAPAHAKTHAEDALLVEFVVRAEHSNVVTRTPAASHARPRPASPAQDDPAMHGLTDDAASLSRHGADAQEHTASAALDLQLPQLPVSAPVVERGASEPSSDLPGRPTRFERQWVQDGNALDAASWRSPVVRAALGLFGGPPRKCDEVERRLRRPDCLPDEEDFERR